MNVGEQVAVEFAAATGYARIQPAVRPVLVCESCGCMFVPKAEYGRRSANAYYPDRFEIVGDVGSFPGEDDDHSCDCHSIPYEVPITNERKNP